MSWWKNIAGGARPRPPRQAAAPGASIYEQRALDRGARTVVVEDGRILGTLDEHGDLVRLDEPPVDDPSSWPPSWWQRVGEFRR